MTRKNFFKIVVDIVKYGWYYTEVASREVQQKSLTDAGPEGKKNLENRRPDSTDNPEISNSLTARIREKNRAASLLADRIRRADPGRT